MIMQNRMRIQNAHILLAEDNPELNHAMCEILESYGYQVTSAENGQRAIELLKQTTPDIILCDIMMPIMDGYAVLRHVRNDPTLRITPFIFLTALTSLADQRMARELGIDDYLIKPVGPQDMAAAINNVLRRRQVVEEEIRRQSDELRNRIVALLQHEFRTPLTFVLGYAEFLIDSTVNQSDGSQMTAISSEELRKSALAILDGGQRLQRLIETFLLLADLQNRQVRVEDNDTLPAIDMWRDVVQQFTAPLTSAKLTPILSNANRSALVTTNADLIREALRRLLDNAIQYKRPNSKYIWLSIERVSVYVGFRLRDEGIGIPAEQIKNFAQPFEQFDRNSRTNSGAGLSMALVQRVAQLHGGKLEIESEYGKGSTFTLWIAETEAGESS
jgi:signal transduction histidine kinase